MSSKLPIDPDELMLPVEIREVHTLEWSSEEEFTVGEHVIVLIKTVVAEANKLAIMMRFVTAYELDALIEMLILKRESVWGKWKRNPEISEDIVDVDD